MDNIMRLTKLRLVENKDFDNYWELDSFELGFVNLITAKNATGKTRLVNVLSSLSQLINGQLKILRDIRYEAEFEDKEDKYSYVILIKESRIIEEFLIFNGSTKISRNKDKTKIWYELENKFVESDIPSNMLCITRRDKKQHPYYEKLFEWANNTITYRFGVGLGHTRYSAIENLSDDQLVDFKQTEDVHTIFLKGMKLFGNDYVDQIIEDFNSIGYEITELGIRDIPEIKVTNLPIQHLSGLFVREKGIKAIVNQNSISSGMFRALSLIIQINYLEFKNIGGSILIDDIGEGLDFDRSRKLIELLLKKSVDNFTQIVMTTNDRFVMNAIDLKYWSIVIRDGQKCSVINYNNSKDLFDDFEFTGLNNFDFLSSEFYINGYDEPEE